MDEGSEHLVFLDLIADDVIKLTKRGLYGEYYYLVNGLVHQSNCTPAEYLIRLRLLGDHFGFAPIAMGVTVEGQIVSRQPFISGEPPSQPQVDEFLLESGLTPVKQNCWLWKSTQHGLAEEEWVGDARSDNFVRTAHGIVPIDLRMWRVYPAAGAHSE